MLQCPRQATSVLAQHLPSKGKSKQKTANKQLHEDNSEGCICSVKKICQGNGNVMQEQYHLGVGKGCPSDEVAFAMMGQRARWQESSLLRGFNSLEQVWGEVIC